MERQTFFIFWLYRQSTAWELLEIYIGDWIGLNWGDLGSTELESWFFVPSFIRLLKIAFCAGLWRLEKERKICGIHFIDLESLLWELFGWFRLFLFLVFGLLVSV